MLNAALTRGLAKGLYRVLQETTDPDERPGRVTAFIQEYLRGFSEGHERLRVIENEARRIGRARVEAALYRSGKRLSELAGGEVTALIAREAEKPEVLAEATRRIDTLRAFGSESATGEASLEELVSEREGQQI